MVACALELHDIPALIVDGIMGRIYPQVALMGCGVKVIVLFEDLDAATDVLRLGYDGDAPFVSGFMTIPLSPLAALIQ